MNFNWKNVLPHLGILAFFAVLALAYNAPLLEGKKLDMHDMQQVSGIAKELNDFYADPANKGEVALWTNSLFSGMPAYQIVAPKPGMWILHINNILTQMLPGPAGILFLMMFCFYIMGRALGLNRWAAAIGAIAFAFSSYNIIIIKVGHVTKAWALAYAAPVIAGTVLLYRGKIWSGFGLFTLGMALELCANHYQITYYLGLGLIFLVLGEAFQAIKEKQLPQFAKATGLAIVGAIVALGANYTNFAITNEYAKDTMRGESDLKAAEGKKADGLDLDYAFNWSYGISETGSIIIPNMNGGGSMGKLSKNSATYKAMQQNGIPEDQAKSFTENAPTYFGLQPSTAGPTYFGAIIMFLFVLGLFLMKNASKWWIVAGMVFLIVLSWGKNWLGFNTFIFNNLPYYNKFRAVSMALSVVALFVAWFGATGLSKLVDQNNLDTQKLNKGLKLATLITGGFCLLFVLLPGMFFDFSSAVDQNFKDYPWLLSALLEDRESLLRMDALRSLALILASAGLVWAGINGKLKMQTAILIIGLLIVIDNWTIDKRYLTDKDFVSKSKIAVPFEKTATDEQILKDTSLYYRVFDLSSGDPFNDNRTSYFHKSIGGYNPAKLSRYQDLITNHISKMNMGVLSMLNTKYIVSAQQGQAPEVQRNMGAMGNAWFVPEYKIVKNAKEEIDGLNNFNPAEYALIDVRFEQAVKGKSFGIDTSAKIVLTQYKPHKLTYEYEASKAQLAIFSDVYYEKGWKATIDGNSAPHFRANYLLRAMVLPAGKHTVAFTFEPDTYHNAEQVSLASSIVLLVVVLGALFMALKPKT